MGGVGPVGHVCQCWLPQSIKANVLPTVLGAVELISLGGARAACGYEHCHGYIPAHSTPDSRPQYHHPNNGPPICAHPGPFLLYHPSPFQPRVTSLHNFSPTPPPPPSLR